MLLLLVKYLYKELTDIYKPKKPANFAPFFAPTMPTEIIINFNIVQIIDLKLFKAIKIIKKVIFN